MIKVTCQVRGYELSQELPPIIVESHWSYDSMVVLKIQDTEYTVVGKDLLTAIKNAMNSARF